MKLESQNSECTDEAEYLKHYFRRQVLSDLGNFSHAYLSQEDLLKH